MAYTGSDTGADRDAGTTDTGGKKQAGATQPAPGCTISMNIFQVFALCGVFIY